MPQNYDVINHDGMHVLVVHEMQKRFDPETGAELPSPKMDDVQLVHSTEIAKYYGIDHADAGDGKDTVAGVWTMVFQNRLGRRVLFNTEETEPTNRYIRDWRILKDTRGVPYDTKEIIKIDDSEHGAYQVREVDDGMYVRLDDLLRYAKAKGWKKGGGHPEQVREAAGEDRLARLEGLVERLMLAVASTAVPAGDAPRQPEEKLHAASKKPGNA